MTRESPINVSFTEEFWFNQKDGTFIGRVEWFDDDEPYDKAEVSVYAMNRDDALKLREKYEDRDLTKQEFDSMLKEIEELKDFD